MITLGIFFFNRVSFLLSLILLFGLWGMTQPSHSNSDEADHASSNSFVLAPKDKHGHSIHPDISEELRNDSLHPISHNPQKLPDTCKLKKNWVVYGFHPHYMKRKWKNYNFQLLSHVSFFSYVIDSETGGYLKSKNKAGADSKLAMERWRKTAMVDSAHAKGCRVDLTLTIDTRHQNSRDLFRNEAAVNNCIKTVSELLELKKADGVCVDIEDVSTSHDKSLFFGFLKKLKEGLNKTNPKLTLSVTFGASDIYSASDIQSLAPYIDYYIIMGYDYYGSWSRSAGPVAPMQGNGGSNLGVSIDKYLDQGVAKEKLVLALPYYGNEWETKGPNFVLDDTVSFLGSRTFRDLKREFEPLYERKWETKGNTSYFIREKNGHWYQAWIPDSAAMALKFQLVKKKGIAGTGIWALGMDHGYQTLWDLLHYKFGACTHDSIYQTHHETADKGNQNEIPGSLVPIIQSQTIRWGFAASIVIAFAVLTLVIVFNRKLQQEVFNRFNNHFLFALLTTVLSVLVLDFILQYISGIPFGLSLAIATGLGLVIIGYIRGQKAGLEREDKT